MESQLPAPRPSGETGAYNRNLLPPTPENIAVAQNSSSPERSSVQEIQPTVSVHQPPMLPVPSQVAQPAAQQKPLLNPLGAQDDTPSVASDDEVIEKEWVDKAKKIIIQTKDNPYQQERQVSKLQADYLKKRYGKDVKITSD